MIDIKKTGGVKNLLDKYRDAKDELLDSLGITSLTDCEIEDCVIEDRTHHYWKIDTYKLRSNNLDTDDYTYYQEFKSEVFKSEDLSGVMVEEDDTLYILILDNTKER